MFFDLRLAIRNLLRSPLHSFTIVAILALGLGANAAIFSLVRGVLLRPLPYPAAEQVVLLNQSVKGEQSVPFSWPNYQDLRREQSSFSAIGLYQRGTFTLTERGPAEQLVGAAVEAEFFRVIGMPPIVGRVFSATEDKPGAPAVVVLRESLWRRKFGGRSDVVGESIVLQGQPHTIVGVLPNAVISPTRAELWVPIAPRTTNPNWQFRRNQPGIFAFARLKDTVDLATARAELRQIGERLQQAYPQDCAQTLPQATRLLDALVGNYRASLWLLFGAVALLLLIACANVAALQLARSLGRAREFAVRAALGAGRGALVRLVVTENVVLALCSGALGLLAAFWSLDALIAMSPGGVRFEAVTLDVTVMLFSLALAALVGVLAGLWPAWRASRTDLNEAIQGAGQKGTTPASSQWARQGMVTLQVALTVVLLATAGLFLRSVQQMQRFQFGFDPHNLLLFRVSVPDDSGPYQAPEKQTALFAALQAKLAALPGVAAAGANYSAPLRTQWSSVFDVEGRAPFPPEQQPAMEMGVIDENYFATLGLPILRGRNFNSSDTPNAPRALIIDQRMADTLWPSEDPIGKVVLRGLASQPIEQRRCVVVGVVPSIAIYGIETAAPYFQGYLSHVQEPFNEMFLLLRTRVSPRSVLDAARATVAAVAPDAPVYGVTTMDELIAQEYSSPALTARLVAFFASAALLLAALGLNGIVAHAVTTRRREIGIRMALGALRTQVVRLVLRQGAAPLGTGLLVGIAGAIATGRLVERQLYHVTPFDPLVIAGTAALLGAVGLLALWLPARRAARTDPSVVLRSE